MRYEQTFLGKRLPLSLGCLVLLVALAFPSVATAQLSPYGVNAHAPGGAALRKLFKRVDKAGIVWVRIDFAWALVEPVRGDRDWTIYDKIVEEARRRDLRILANIAYTPGWATDGPEFSGVPRSASEWHEFCWAAATRYKKQIKYWEVWNEPNQPHFWAGTRRQYLDVALAAGADAIHKADPSLKVGGPGLAHLISGDKDWYRWLRETLKWQGRRLDFVTHHVYDSDGPWDVTKHLAESTPFGGEPRLWDVKAPSVWEVLRERGYQGLPFWLTETGWASDAVGAQKQADYYVGFLEEWFTGRPGRDWVQTVFFYELHDDPRDDVPGWGILTSSARKKKSYRAYKKFIRDHR